MNDEQPSAKIDRPSARNEGAPTLSAQDFAADAFMRRAVELACENVRSGKGGPFAAVIVRDGEIIGTGVNRVTATNDPTAHAEVVAIREACAKLQSFQLEGCDIYSTCEPCPMCLAAIYWARPSRIFFGATKEDAAHAGFDDAAIYAELGLPIADRNIPMTQVLGKDALRPFEEWGRMLLRVQY